MQVRILPGVLDIISSALFCFIVFTRFQAFSRFDLIALGDVWGRWGDANNKSQTVERPGRNPILIAFELAGNSPSERLSPGGNGAYVAEKSGSFARPKE